jgi:hypothetical protein
MADGPVVDLELDVTGVPNGTGGTVRFELVASASAELAGVRLSIDKLRAPFALGVGVENGQVRLLFQPLPPTRPQGMGAELQLPGFEGGGYLAHVGSEWRGVLTAQLGRCRSPGSACSAPSRSRSSSSSPPSSRPRSSSRSGSPSSAWAGSSA